MDPAEFFRGEELLGAEGEGEDDFGVGNCVLEVVEIVDLNDLELREIFCQALGEPKRSDPEVEAVGSGY